MRCFAIIDYSCFKMFDGNAADYKLKTACKKGIIALCDNPFNYADTYLDCSCSIGCFIMLKRIM